MALWKDNTAARLAPTPAAPSKEPARFDAPLLKPEPVAPSTPSWETRREPLGPSAESLIAANITIEGKIEGGGSVRIAGKFKGDVNIQGDLTVEAGAKLTGGVRAEKVTIAGELEGNIDHATLVELQHTGVVIGDVKARSLSVAAGARLRGQAEFGWDDGKGSKPGRHANGGDIGAVS